MKPVRWRDPDSAAPLDARALLDAAWGTRAMTAAERARSARQVARIAALPVATGVLASLKGLAAAAGIGAGSAIVLLGVITAVETPSDDARAPSVETSATPVKPARPPASSRGALRPEAASSMPAASASAERPPVVRPSSLPRSVDEVTVPAEEIPEPKAAGETPGEASPGGDSLAEEAALLEEARGLLAGSPGEALARLERHAQRHPQGRLGIEREFLAIDALRRLGRGAEASARGEALLARSTGSPYEARVRQMLGHRP